MISLLYVIAGITVEDHRFYLSRRFSTASVVAVMSDLGAACVGQRGRFCGCGGVCGVSFSSFFLLLDVELKKFGKRQS